MISNHNLGNLFMDGTDSLFSFSQFSKRMKGRANLPLTQKGEIVNASQK